ncbi:MAG: hypothetical protein LBE13_14740 [Bacteroidales bacterium]|jgi:hypothetical protein|nr:hypothetical protein [Bacteroidales bacterium]
MALRQKIIGISICMLMCTCVSITDGMGIATQQYLPQANEQSQQPPILETFYPKGSQQRLVGDIKKLNGENLLAFLSCKDVQKMFSNADITMKFNEGIQPINGKTLNNTYPLSIPAAELVFCMLEIEKHCSKLVTFEYDKTIDERMSISSLESSMSMYPIDDNPISKYTNDNNNEFADNRECLDENIDLYSRDIIYPTEQLPPKNVASLDPNKTYKYSDIENIISTRTEYINFFYKIRETIKIKKEEDNNTESSEANTYTKEEATILIELLFSKFGIAFPPG